MLNMNTKRSEQSIARYDMVGGVLLLISTSVMCLAGTHVETFNGSYWDGTWYKFSVNMPLDGMTETPNTVIRSDYDWTKAWPS